jgi:hypothetical protein
MKKLLFLIILICVEKALTAQYIYTIKADSVKITNSCDTAELIIENHTQNVPGFLFNKGRGRTEFRKPLVKISDTLYTVGVDSLKLPNAWLQGGNAWGTNGILGTKDNTHIDFYTNNQQRGRWTNNGNLLIGSVFDDGSKFQVGASGAISINPVLSRPTDRIMIGGYNNPGDGQNFLFRSSSDNGTTYRNILMERDGHIGLGASDVPFGWWVGNPVVRIYADGKLSLMTSRIYYGNEIGPINSSALITTVSSVNEWTVGSGYPSGENSYYFGTILTGAQSGKVRAPLVISGRELVFYSGASEAETVRLTENRNLLIGTTTDNGNKLQVTGNTYFNGNQHVTGSARFSGLISSDTLTRIIVSDANGNLYYRQASGWAANDIMNSDLAVNGTISAQKMTITQTGVWPDYVFSSHYKLPSLKEVEQFIQQNSHLPGIPSAAEVEKKGIDVGENQAALLKKIEELTLYLIQQQKELQSLRQELAELKNIPKNK